MLDPSKPRRHVLLVTVNNEPGVLARIIGLFSGRGWNIDGLTVAPVTSSKYAPQNGVVSRMTIVTEVTDEQHAHIITQIDRLVPVLEVLDLTDNPDRVEADVTLVKVLTDDPVQQTQVVQMAQLQFRAMSVRTRHEFIVLRFLGQERAAADFVSAITHFGVNVETVHSGIVAIA